ncbi:response regulator [Paenibacillus sp. FSL W8-1187]|uniref:response regulator n=1 Tax=Paenibacillus sp. FSL W8-1187 TaxID=2975339 RepID=UPI0030D707E3
MANVLIVDDEPIICGAVSRFLLRSGLGIDKVETALNGFEALDYLRLEPFDLVVTDIQMGGMNGIELMEIIFSEHPGLPVIVISAHEDFHYAQQALRLGALDYLIKPVDAEHLGKVVQGILDKRQSGGIAAWDSAIRHKYAFEQLITTKTVLLNEWFGEEAEWDEEEIGSVLADLGLSLPGPYYCVWSIDLDLDGAGRLRQTRFTVKDRKLLLFAALNIVEESLAGWESLSFYMQGGHLATIFSLTEEELRLWGGDALAQVNLVARSACRNLRDYLRIEGRIGISRTQQGLASIPRLHQEAREAIGDGSAAAWGLPVTFIGDIERSADKRMLAWQVQLEQLVKDLRQSTDPSQAAAAADSLMDGLERAGIVDERRSSCLLQAAYCLHGLLDDSRGMLEPQELPPEPQTLSAAVASRERLPEVRRYLAQAAAAVIAGNLRRERSTVQRAMEFMKRRYSDKGLKLQDVAREVHLSPNYFSYLFKKTTDKNLWDYLTELRMEEARRLLLSSDMKRYEIAESIGYESPEHFSRVFKKYYGVSPADFRK